LKVDTYMKERSVGKIEGLILGHKVDGRCVYDKAAKLTLVQRCLEPGISVAASAMANGVNANLLRKWILQYQRKQRSKTAASTKSNAQSAPVLLPVKLSQGDAAPAPISVEAIKPKAPTHGAIEIEYAGARIVLRGLISAQQLGVVLDCLGRRA
jgi:transposase